MSRVAALPYNFRVDFEISMYQNVPHADDLLPGNIGRESPNVRRNGSGRFANDLQMPKEPTLEQLIPFEGFLVARRVATDRGDGL